MASKGDGKAKVGTWLERARRAVASVEPLLQQNPESADLKAAMDAFSKAEHEFEQASFFRGLTKQGSGAEADRLHRVGRKAFAEGEAAWESYKARAPH